MSQRIRQMFHLRRQVFKFAENRRLTRTLKVFCRKQQPISGVLMKLSPQRRLFGETQKTEINDEFRKIVHFFAGLPTACDSLRMLIFRKPNDAIRLPSECRNEQTIVVYQFDFDPGPIPFEKDVPILQVTMRNLVRMQRLNHFLKFCRDSFEHVSILQIVGDKGAKCFPLRPFHAGSGILLLIHQNAFGNVFKINEVR